MPDEPFGTISGWRVCARCNKKYWRVQLGQFWCSKECEKNDEWKEDATSA